MEERGGKREEGRVSREKAEAKREEGNGSSRLALLALIDSQLLEVSNGHGRCSLPSALFALLPDQAVNSFLNSVAACFSPATTSSVSSFFSRRALPTCGYLLRMNS